MTANPRRYYKRPVEVEEWEVDWYQIFDHFQQCPFATGVSHGDPGMLAAVYGYELGVKDTEINLSKFGPKTDEHSSVGEKCPACYQPFAVGEYTTLIALGPGDDEESRQRARDGQAYNAVAVEVHWSCATGFDG